MCSSVNTKLSEIRKSFVISVAKNTLLNNDNPDDSVMFNSILLSWFENINSNKAFEEKYNTFKQLASNSKISTLFNIILSLNGDYNHDVLLINKCISLYHEIMADNSIKDMFLKCDYTIPNTFSKREKYEDLSIKENVIVFYNFEKKLDEIKNKCFNKEKK